MRIPKNKEKFQAKPDASNYHEKCMDVCVDKEYGLPIYIASRIKGDQVWFTRCDGAEGYWLDYEMEFFNFYCEICGTQNCPLEN